MKYLLTLVCTLFLFASCSKDGGDGPLPPDKTERTVLIYMAGENNLTVYNGYRYLYYDLQEIIEGSKQLKDNQRLFVFVDSLNTNSQQASNPFIMEVHGGKTYIRKQFTSDFYSCDPKKFREVIDWVIGNGEADSYGMVLWGHANGWVVSNDSIEENAQSRGTRTYGQDNGTDTGGSLKIMNITQMARAMKGLPKMDFIFADCCNMMCAEVGYVLRDATEYLIGSPAEIPSEGAPYDIMVPLFFKSGSDSYRNLMETYYNYFLEENSHIYTNPFSVPMSVIHTRYIGELVEATREILGRFTSPIPAYPEYLNLSASDIAFYMYFDAPLMYDMYALIKANTSEEDFLKWQEIYKKAVPYYHMSMKWDTIYDSQYYAFSHFNPDASLYGCVSMFVPMNTGTYNNGAYHYNKTFKNYEWNRKLNWERFGW